MPRIAIAGFQHETNSFTPHRAGYDHFCEHRDRPPLCRGYELITALQGGSYALSGFLHDAPPDWEIVPLLWTSGGAGGVVTEDAFERITEEILERLTQSIPLDGVYLDLHGAMVSEIYDDAEGELLRRIRQVIGESIPVVVSLDYHANLSPAMLQHADALMTCRTYPHVDRPETGQASASTLARLLKDGRPQGRALRQLPFLLPIEFQCTLTHPSQTIVEWQPPAPVIHCSYAAGFPASDTHSCGPAVVAYADSQNDADHVANAYLDFILRLEGDFSAEFLDEDAGVAKAVSLAATTHRPIIIADTQDNPGAGGSGDTTGILHALRKQGAKSVLVGYFCDPDAAQKASAAGPGSRVRLSLGKQNQANLPFEGEFEVIRCTNTPFFYTGPVAGNVKADLGEMALVRIDGIDIALTSRRAQAYDAAPFEQLGADPSSADILVLKSSCHFRAEFGMLSDHILLVLSPGNYQSDPLKYPYRKVRQEVIRVPRSR